MRILVVTVLALVIGACGRGEEPPTARPANEVERTTIVETFNAYRNAVLASDGNAASALITFGSIDYYESIRTITISGAEADVRALGLMDKMLILSLRARMSAEELDALTGKTLIAHMIDNQWVGSGPIMRHEIGEITVTGNRASAELTLEGLKSEGGFEFVGADDVWRFDLVHAMEFAAPAMKMRIAQLGGDEDQVLEMVVGGMLDIEEPSALWLPLRP